VEKFAELKTELKTDMNIIAEQTRPRKVLLHESASKLSSSIRRKYFDCKQVPLESELSRLKRFNPPENKANLLLAEVKKYIGQIQNKYLTGKRKEVEHMQPEIRDNFWPNTRSFLRNQQNYEMINEKEYTFTKYDDDDEGVEVKGKIDHTIQRIDCAFASATLEDKAICLKMTDKEVGQAVTQVDFEVEQMEKFLNYAPVEYVGLLQNGPVWIAVLRRIDRGKVLLTYIQTSPAFSVDEPLTVNESSCSEIARLIEHAYCTADEITENIMCPEKRPMRALYTINEYQRHSDDEDEGEDDQDAAKGCPEDCAVTVKVGGLAAAVPAKQIASHRQQKKIADSLGSRKSRSDWDTAGWSSSSPRREYFLLPLSEANVARHAATVS
jgi:hypothetical protein